MLLAAYNIFLHHSSAQSEIAALAAVTPWKTEAKYLF